MYFSSLEIESIGPIDYINLEFPIDDGRPKPVIIVGENGTGKSIFLSHLVNSLVVGKQYVFDDGEIEKGKVYKYRSPRYIKSGKDFSYAKVSLQSGIQVEECQLNRLRDAFENSLGYVPARQIWTRIGTDKTSIYEDTFQAEKEATSNLFKKQCCLYFPVNRFEEPAWLNLENLKSKTQYSELKQVEGYSNREIVCTSPLKANKNWLLDLLFDRQIYELKTQRTSVSIGGVTPPVDMNLFLGHSGPSTNIYNAVNQVLKVILRDQGNIRLGAGGRKDRQLAVMKDELLWVPNLFQLSTGEVLLFNLFISILRDYDLSEGDFKTLSDIKGIVIIDEIDAHLHAVHQREVLPELIASFPNVQFIVTTHSPLFLLGMEQKFGDDQFCIFNMPNGERVAASDFSEFNAAYEAFKETTLHREEIRAEIERHAKPVLIVEGDYDIRYLKKAAELLGKQAVLDRVHLKDGGGFGNLDKAWKGYDNVLAEVTPNKIILLFDCDTNKAAASKGKVFKRVIPSIEVHPIRAGIENLFSLATVNKAEAHSQAFIDTEDSIEKRVRGNYEKVPAKKTVNKDEKGNLCSWLCENGTYEDFISFTSVFQIVEGILGE